MKDINFFDNVCLLISGEANNVVDFIIKLSNICFICSWFYYFGYVFDYFL